MDNIHHSKTEVHTGYAIRSATTQGAVGHGKLYSFRVLEDSCPRHTGDIKVKRVLEVTFASGQKEYVYADDFGRFRFDYVVSLPPP